MLPVSYDRVLAALKRLSPSWPSTDTTTSVGKELASIAVALGMGADHADAILDEIYPDTTVELIERWEAITRVPVRTGDNLATRQSRVLAVLRRLSGPRLDQLSKMLAPILDQDVEDITFVETLRSQIEDGLTVDSGVVSVSVPTAAPLVYNVGKPYPGVVDSSGVRLYLSFDSYATPTVTLTSPVGTVWAVTVTANSAFYANHDDFLGEPAGGNWLLSIQEGTSGKHLLRYKAMVSNDSDSTQIFNFFVYRDLDEPGTPDVEEAQRFLSRTALAHFNSKVIERTAFVVGDERSVVGREPV